MYVPWLRQLPIAHCQRQHATDAPTPAHALPALLALLPTLRGQNILKTGREALGMQQEEEIDEIDWNSDLNQPFNAHCPSPDLFTDPSHFEVSGRD